MTRISPPCPRLPLTHIPCTWHAQHAAEAAQVTGAPVCVVFSLVTKFLGAGARQFGFMLRGKAVQVDIGLTLG